MIKLLGVVPEDFVNYKEPSMFLITCFCDWKCCHEGNFPESVCQNNSLGHQKYNIIKISTILDFYYFNDIVKALVIGGLEPFLQFEEILELVERFRNMTNDPIIIYTGYNEDEIKDKVDLLKNYPNIIIKFGRYIPGHKPHRDEVLGVNLASDNQYAKKIS